MNHFLDTLIVHPIFTILPLLKDVLWGYIGLQFTQLGDETCTAVLEIVGL